MSHPLVLPCITYRLSCAGALAPLVHHCLDVLKGDIGCVFVVGVFYVVGTGFYLDVLCDGVAKLCELFTLCDRVQSLVRVKVSLHDVERDSQWRLFVRQVWYLVDERDLAVTELTGYPVDVDDELDIIICEWTVHASRCCFEDSTRTAIG